MIYISIADKLHSSAGNRQKCLQSEEYKMPCWLQSTDLQCTWSRNTTRALLMMYLDGVVVAVGAGGRGRAGSKGAARCGGPAGELAGDGRQGSSPLLPRGPRLLWSWSGRGRAGGVQAPVYVERASPAPPRRRTGTELRHGMWTSGSRWTFV